MKSSTDLSVGSQVGRTTRKHSFHGTRHGFTLVELLVVIGIIAILLSLLMPALARARFQAVFTTCAERQRQLVMAMQMYANEHRGFLPRHDLGSGRNLWDVSIEFYDVMRTRYQMPHVMFFCPDARSDLEQPGGYDQFGSFYVIGWSVWIPRYNGGMVPPEPGDPGFVIRDTTPFRGPIRVGDPLFNKNPVLSCVIITDPAIPPDDIDLSRDTSAMTNYYGWTPHRWKGGLVGNNQTWADGHVERIPGGSLRARYMGNYWNWR